MNPPLPGTAAKVVLSIDSEQIDGPGYRFTVSGDYAVVTDRLVPLFLIAEFEGDAVTPKISARVELRDGAPCVVDLHYDASECREIRQTHVREVEIKALIELFAGFSVQLTKNADGTYAGHGIHSGSAFDREFWRESVTTMRAARGNRTITPELLQEVANVYRDNFKREPGERGGPTKAVQDRFFVSARQASNYIYQARRKGYLPPTSPGKKRA